MLLTSKRCSESLPHSCVATNEYSTIEGYVFSTSSSISQSVMEITDSLITRNLSNLTRNDCSLCALWSRRCGAAPYEATPSNHNGWHTMCERATIRPDWLAILAHLHLFPSKLAVVQTVYTSRASFEGGNHWQTDVPKTRIPETIMNVTIPSTEHPTYSTGLPQPSQGKQRSMR